MVNKNQYIPMKNNTNHDVDILLFRKYHTILVITNKNPRSLLLRTIPQGCSCCEQQRELTIIIFKTETLRTMILL